MSIIDIASLCRIWKTFLLGFGLLTFLSKKTVYVAEAEGNIGCLFAESLCMPHLEWCYDDFAFGKCLPQYGLEPEELFREPLEENQVAVLRAMLEELQGAGLGWQDPFVQCRMQGALFALRTKSDLPKNLCASLAPPASPLTLPSSNSIDGIDSNPDPEAFVRYAPPAADLFYGGNPLRKRNRFSPPEDAMNPFVERELQEEILNAAPYENLYDARAEAQKELQNEILLRTILSEEFANDRSVPQELPRDYGYQNDNEFVPNFPDVLKRKQNFYPASQDPQPSHFKERQHLLEEEAVNELLDEIADQQQHESPFREVAQHRNSKQHLVEAENELPLFPFKSNFEYGRPETGIYTEGGVIYPEAADQGASFDSKEEARNVLADILGFTRHERLDVKKPGPVVVPPSSAPEVVGKTSNNSTKQETESGPKMKKVPNNDHSGNDDHAPHIVDNAYAHVRLKNPIDSWKDGERIVDILAETLKMEKYFIKVRVDRHEVSFFVAPNPERRTAQEVARLINDPRTKANISRRYGIIIEAAGVGDKTKQIDPSLVTSERLNGRAEDAPDVTHVMAYMFAGAGAAAAVVIVITLFLIKRHDKKKDKLGGLPTGITGAETCSKDYQELCRARMAGKGTPAADGSGRITTLAKESEKPQSNRSSTSSWNEEPALTNMDISTGHMVLSYMEDHLRNKGRLQREWEALCRYEAEPGARDAALQPECNNLNRQTAPLPFDHSRVVLNHLANAEGMDYINASTITDHDPRAPAYVAAQGPLSTTIAHFWQMIWEQGAVVIVALCKLDENGESQCARYWPEEGAETYHIYEVHLVSEHVWCDDYLVRSFYLKNIKTGETRTVTQFHFLSWPQAGVPTSAKALLEFRRKVNKSYRGRSCPIVVHSSNGGGRTGAYILLDLVLGRMNKGAREIDIAATLEHLRDQRAGLVATRQQFEFVLMAVAEEVHAILKALPQNSQSGSQEKRDKDLEKESTSKDTDEKDTEKKVDEKEAEKSEKTEKKPTPEKKSQKSPKTEKKK
ncbi:receptor-type tyrosine-protein phosphatase N2 [Culicoides brevitarsis]|uniref:receptor-type tyrosine-protein phosphatase N2 n=1 Tax=Culicoides brevitarsis TaxID=469753 RepID=UPI00307BB50E